MTTQQTQALPLTGANRLAAPALALGVIALVSSFVVVGGALGVAGVVLSAVALRTAARTGAGRGRAVTAVVLSCLAVVVSVWMVVVAIWFAHKTQSCYPLDDVQPWFRCVEDHVGR